MAVPSEAQHNCDKQHDCFTMTKLSGSNGIAIRACGKHRVRWGRPVVFCPECVLVLLNSQEHLILKTRDTHTLINKFVVSVSAFVHAPIRDSDLNHQEIWLSTYTCLDVAQDLQHS